MSELIRVLSARLPSKAIAGDFVDKRSLADLIEEQAGVPVQQTAMAQLQAKASGNSPVPMVNKIQLDR